MATFVEVHPDNPQPRTVGKVVERLREGALVAFPTDSGYALGGRLDDQAIKDRIGEIRRLDDKHHYTLLCADFAQLGQLVHVDNAIFRAVKAATPGPYTFILPATKEVPRRLLHAKKKTVGVRIPDHPLSQALLAGLGRDRPLRGGGRHPLRVTKGATTRQEPRTSARAATKAATQARTSSSLCAAESWTRMRA